MMVECRVGYDKYHSVIKVMLCILLIMPLCVHAETIYLSKGGARTIKSNTPIDTVFTTDSNVVNYNMISDNEIVIYGVDNGDGEILIVQNDNTRSIKVTVDPLIGKLAKQIEDQFVGSTIGLKKVGDSYLLTGTAADEESRDAIYQIVGEALGLERSEIKTKFSSDSSDSAKYEQDNIGYLSQYTYRKLQNKMNLPFANQVNVKISIVELNRNYSDALGIEWGQAMDVGSFVLNKLKFDATQLTSVINALGNESVARVLAEPNLSVLSGETADFLVGGEIPILTSSSNGSSVSYKEVGIKMLVAAKVENSQKVRLTLSQEVSNVDSNNISKTNELVLPSIKSRKSRTTIELADGESFVLAGLLSESEKEVLKKIPYIGDIPVLGAFFRSTSSQRERTELVVVATVNLVRPISSSQVSLPSWQRSTLLERYLNIGGSSNQTSKKAVVDFLEQGGFIY
ncbi:type II and III secretion system protein family protein [Rosenbergiella nectarea]|uniref:Pilus assembly protein CpaC n=1 Tax=Rosenbergiella nectarea TaxID=988801 RepID=A0A1H9ITT2_9GAMM|nr:pilus assembly protein N-terminal domain-containing protein [Rosenbergiella nectarea]MBT0729830.1 type II and III secretion system protein family protein [Rosenbergiella nectarea subsp. apis]SEQ78191.1 pilus assembly protein CpaC [Rosenbergiella nectarea]